MLGINYTGSSGTAKLNLTEDGRVVDKADPGCGTDDSIGARAVSWSREDMTKRMRQKGRVAGAQCATRRLKKNAHGLIVACALANLLMAAPPSAVLEVDVACLWQAANPQL